MKDSKKLLKMIAAFLIYFLYSMYLTPVITSFGIGDTLAKFIADILFLILIVVLYKDNLKEDFQNLKKEYKVSKILKTMLVWALIIFATNMAMGVISTIIYPNLADDSNTLAMGKLDILSRAFKAFIFGTLAEELLFRESIADNIENKWIFILVSAAVYTTMLCIFATNLLWIDIVGYFLVAGLFSYAYTRHNRNIIIIMLIKAAYNLLPFILSFM